MRRPPTLQACSLGNELTVLWRPVTQTTNKHEGWFQSVDVVLQEYDLPLEPLALVESKQLVSKPIEWMVQRWREISDEEKPEQLIFKLILPHKHGYLAQANLFEQRLVDCPEAQKTHTFHDAGHECDHIDLLNTREFHTIAQGAVAIIQGESHLSTWACLQSLEEVLHSRLSLSWLLNCPIERRTLVLVGGYPHPQSYKGIHEAAEGLAVDLILVNEQGHWLQDEAMSHLRKEFWPIDMTADDGLPGRIADRVAAYPGRVDGLLTVYDVYVIATALAAKMLELPTESIDAYSIARDKFLTRKMTEDGIASFKIDNMEQIADKLQQWAVSPVYPLIVKPTDGYSSECVFRVSNESDLLFAVDRALSRYGGSVIVESYVEGPEVDANFVLCDGEILFFEIADDLPSDGDRKDASVRDTFAEYGMVYPSALPEDEITTIRNSLHSMILKMGFKTGVFHAEARMRNSRMEYRGTDGLPDLSERQDRCGGDSECFLLEVNARIPGFYGSVASRRTYGVDYFVQTILAALGDHQRMRMLSQPFRTGVDHGAQYWCQVLFIPPTQGGICRQDSCQELQQRCPELMQHVPTCEMLFSVGDRIPSPDLGILKFLAYFVVVSRQSRSHLAQVARAIQKNFRSPLKG